MSKERSISVPVWWKSPNGGLLRRECLEPQHPGSTYQYIRDQGLRPEDFGVPSDKPYCEVNED